MFFDTETKIPEDKLNAETLGGKGYGLAWMKSQGVNVPPAIIIPTDACVAYMKDPKAVMHELEGVVPKITDFFIDQFGYMPLLSVRSGARVSMPGMMDTILNVGIDQTTYPFWKEKLGEKCVEDCYDRLHEMYGATVLGLKDKKHPDLPDAQGQLLKSIEAVFKSWMNDRAVFYRKMHNIPEEWGTAVVVQAMVFGNLGNTSGTGVLFTRNPDTGENVITGEFLENAQGEDVVAGVRTPLPIAAMMKWNKEVTLELFDVVKKLEGLKKDVQDVEFTVQEGKLYILQTRNAKRSARAAVRIAVEMYGSDILTREEALKRVTAKQYDLANQDILDPSFKKEPDFVGISASSGVVSGTIVHTSDEAKAFKGKCVLVTKETTPDDIEGMFASVGVITLEGGATSHAAVVARGMNKPCVVGVGNTIDKFPAGSMISFDGATGRIWYGEVPVVSAESNDHLQTFDKMLFGDNTVPINAVVGEEMLLDASSYLFDQQQGVQLIAKLLAKVKHLYVDLTVDDTVVKSFAMMFEERKEAKVGREQEFLALLETSLTPKEIEKVTVMVSANWKVKKLKLLKGSSDLLTFLRSNGGIWAGEMNDDVLKLIQYKTLAGEKTSIIGKYVEGQRSFETKSRVIARLLG